MQHNLSQDLEVFSDLKYNKILDRTIRESYSVRVVSGQNCNRFDCYDTYTNEIRYRDLPDVRFHNTRDKYINDIEIKVDQIANEISNF